VVCLLLTTPFTEAQHEALDEAPTETLSETDMQPHCIPGELGIREKTPKVRLRRPDWRTERRSAATSELTDGSLNYQHESDLRIPVRTTRSPIQRLDRSLRSDARPCDSRRATQR
jgi:hypothetical protein